MFTLGHLSDWHATSLADAPAGAFANKRFFGWLSWKLRRRFNYRHEVLSALIDDLVEQAPDHIAVTGDLTNVGLESEFLDAAASLRALGDASRVSVIPGNHDCYVATPPSISWDHWADYMRGDGDSARPNGAAPCFDDYPVTRERGDLAIIGACSAIPTAWFQASGELGETQLERLRSELSRLREAGACRVVLIHHPPVHASISARRRLKDADDFRGVIAAEGAELVLHGHCHRTLTSSIDGPDGKVPVVGVRSSAYAGRKDSKEAQYHVYHITRRSQGEGGARFNVRAVVRGFDRRLRKMVDAGRFEL